MKLEITSFEDYKRVYDYSVAEPENFWARVAEGFYWQKKWDQVLDWNFKKPEVKWYLGGKMNITENCLDRHLEANADTTAFIWEPNDPEKDFRKLSYKELHFKVCQFANVLKNNVVVKGERICL